MTIFRTAYATTACSGFVLNPVQEGLEKAHASLGINGMVGVPGGSLLQGQNPFEANVPAFAHPYELYINQHQSTLVQDVRAFGRWDPTQNVFRVSNITDHKLAMLRLKLNYAWLRNGPEPLRDLSPLPMQAYCDWMGKSVAKRFNLDAREEMVFTVVAAWFYLSLFTNEQEFAEKDRNRTVQSIARVLRLPAQEVFTITDELKGPIVNLPQFCHDARAIVKSVRLDGLNPGLVFQMLGGSMYSHQRELCAVAIEHPPTWITLLMICATDRTFKSAGLMRIYEKLNSDMQTQFQHSVAHFLSLIHEHDSYLA